MIKKNKVVLTETQGRFREWLMTERPSGLLIPVEWTGDVGTCSTEIYHKVEDPLLQRVRIHIGSNWDAGKYGTLGLFEAQRIALGMSKALGTMHQAGFVHSDVRDMNVFVNTNSWNPTVFDYNMVTEPYHLEEGMNTHHEIPPEYRTGGCGVDARFDTYQTGNILFRLLHEYSFREKKFLPRGNIPDSTLEIIARATHDNPEQRYKDGTELHDALASLR